MNNSQIEWDEENNFFILKLTSGSNEFYLLLLPDIVLFVLRHGQDIPMPDSKGFHNPQGCYRFL